MSESESGGCGEACSPDDIARSPKKLFSEDSCPDCGSGDLRFGSRDPCEGDYYICNQCGLRILFPLNYRRKFIAPIIDSEKEQRKARMAACMKPRPTITEVPVPSPHPHLDPYLPQRDIRGSECMVYFKAIRRAS